MEQKINEKIGAWLLEDGNSRDKLAQSIGISRQCLNTRINGTSKWYWREVVSIARLTNSNLSELI